MVVSALEVLVLSSILCTPEQHFQPTFLLVLYRMHRTRMVNAPTAAATIANSVGKCMLPSLDITDHFHPLFLLKCLKRSKILSLANPMTLCPVPFRAWIENGSSPLLILDSLSSPTKLCITPLVILGMSKY